MWVCRSIFRLSTGLLQLGAALLAGAQLLVRPELLDHGLQLRTEIHEDEGVIVEQTAARVAVEAHVVLLPLRAFVLDDHTDGVRRPLR
jgi:hypothetical protein